MENQVRARMIRGAAQLLARRGLEGTSFSSVVELTGAPRGSLYHHFPGGKTELIAAAIELVLSHALEQLGRKAGASAVEIAEDYLDIWGGVLTRSRCKVGCSLAAVVVAADSPDLIDRAGAAFRVWRSRLAELLVAGGLSNQDAETVSVMLLAASEGAVILARAERTLRPFEIVREQLIDRVRAATLKPAAESVDPRQGD